MTEHGWYLNKKWPRLDCPLRRNLILRKKSHRCQTDKTLLIVVRVDGLFSLEAQINLSTSNTHSRHKSRRKKPFALVSKKREGFSLAGWLDGNTLSKHPHHHRGQGGVFWLQEFIPLSKHSQTIHKIPHILKV